MERYCALIADVKGSKAYGDEARAALQALMVETLSYLNRFFAEGIVKEVEFSGGDEVQGLFLDPVVAFLYFRMLGLLLGFDVLRGGLGVGNWSVRMDSQGSAGQDGSAYHRARAAISEAKKGRRFDVVIRSEGLDDDALTTLLDHSLGICRMRTGKQTEVACVIELFYPLVPAYWNERKVFSKTLLPDGLHLLENCGSSALRKRSGEGLAARVLGRGVLESPLGSTVPKVFKLDDVGTFRLTDSGLVGAAYHLRRFSGASRQGIDQQMARGRVPQERNAVSLFASCAMRELRR